MLPLLRFIKNKISESEFKAEFFELIINKSSDHDNKYNIFFIKSSKLLFIFSIYVLREAFF